MKQNYCLIKKNKIYADIYDELLEEELSMSNPEHSDKIKNWIKKKIGSSNYTELSEFFSSKEGIIEDVIIKITGEAKNENLQGNTVIMFADDNNMYELFHMEDLTKSHPDEELNEFGSISNIHLQPVYWACAIFKTNYSNGVAKGVELSKQDILDLFVQNYYHIGVMINTDSTMLELEFTGEEPIKTIGTNFVISSTTDIIGFNVIPWIEKNPNPNKLNELGTKLLGKDVYGRLFITLLCPTTNKKFWNISKTTITNIVKILDDDKIFQELTKGLLPDDMYINPYLQLKKFLKK
jgi:hypothetical protein